MLWALFFVLLSAGNKRPARIAMMAMTTSSSIRVKARFLLISLSTVVEVNRIRDACQRSIFPGCFRHRGETHAARADTQFLEIEPFHQRFVNRHTGQDHIGA